jgi:hypothetical protein
MTTGIENAADRPNSGRGTWWSWLRARPLFGVVVSLIIIVVGSLLAAWIQTGGGAAQVKEVTYLGTDNGLNDAYLWIPSGVTPKDPAPAILAVSGYNNSKEYMSNTALELARRGYVVLAIDMEDTGLSSVVAPGDGAWGALDGLNYLRGLPIVNKGRVGEIGMSLGGYAIDLAAAMSSPGSVKSIYFMDSVCLETCTVKIDEGESQGTGTEFPQIMVNNEAGISTGAEIKDSKFLEKWADTTQPVVPGHLYGSVSAGTAREYWERFGDHALATNDAATISHVISWFGMTLGTPTSASGQIWPWMDLGTALGGLGLVFLLFTLGNWLLRRRFFASLNEAPPTYTGHSGRMWWVFALITTLVGPAVFLWAANTAYTDNWFGWEPMATAFAFWLAVVGLISIAILAIGYYTLGRRKGATLVSYGIAWTHGLDWRKIGKSALLALCIVGAGYFVLYVVYSAMHVDFRLWVVTLKVTNLWHFPYMVAYAIPLALYFLATSVVLHGTLRPQNGEATLSREMITNMLILVVGIVGMLALFYIPLEWFGAGAVAGNGMVMINGISLVVLVPTFAGLITYFFRKTGHVYVGAFLCAFFLAWYLVAAETLLVG